MAPPHTARIFTICLAVSIQCRHVTDGATDGGCVIEKTALCMRDALKKPLGVVDWTSVYETTCHISRLLHNYAVVGGRIDDRLQACANPLISISMLG